MIEVMIIVKTIMILIMILLAYEDFRKQEISIILIILFSLLTIIELSVNQQWNSENVVINLLIYLFIGLSVLLYSLIRWGIKEKIVDKKIGKGDLFVSFIFIFIFSPINFVLFLDLSFALGILYYVVTTKTRKRIPLAGIFASIYLIILISTLFQSNPLLSFQNNCIDNIL